MMYECSNCGYRFEEEEAEFKEVDIESECGVGHQFGDHHKGYQMIVPDCTFQFRHGRAGRIQNPVPSDFLQSCSVLFFLHSIIDFQQQKSLGFRNGRTLFLRGTSAEKKCSRDQRRK